MTVSRVVNNATTVRDTTRGAVLEAVRALNYIPNLAARTLASAQDIRIGVIYNNPSTAYLSEFLLGVLDESGGRHAHLMLVKSNVDDEKSEIDAVEKLLDRSVSGVVLPPPLSESVIVRQTLQIANIPTVSLATGRFINHVNCVRINDRLAAFDMTRRLLELGHKHIGFIKGPPDQTASAERLAGFRAALRRAADASAVMAQGHFTFSSGLQAAEKLICAKERPTAIFASNDDMAAATISVAHRRGLSVPKDISVVGFDDTNLAVTIWPALTTVRQPVRTMAAAAVELLVREITARLVDANWSPEDKVFNHTIVERESLSNPHRL